MEYIGGDEIKGSLGIFWIIFMLHEVPVIFEEYKVTRT